MRVLVAGLPPGGAAYRAIHGHGWVDEHYILADLIDAVQGNTAAVYRTVSGRRRVPNPRRYPRPGAEHGKTIGDRAGRSSEDVVAYLDSLKPKGA